MNATTAETAGTQRIALSAREVAGLLNISERQVWRLVSSGGLPQPGRVGCLARWDRATLLTWWQAKQKEAAR